MKRLLSIALLGLLLYNTFGLAVAILCFDKAFETASPIRDGERFATIAVPVPSLPYTNAWENADGASGLVKKDGEFYNVVHQRLENDTLYLTLQTNNSARDRFFELAENMNSLTHADKTRESSSEKTLKLLDELVKSYLPVKNLPFLTYYYKSAVQSASFPDFIMAFCVPVISFDSPPPELS